MSTFSKANTLILSLSLVIGLATLGYLLGNAALKVKELDRTVTVKGLAEREIGADKVIWPIRFNLAGNDLTEVYVALDTNINTIKKFLTQKGVQNEEITLSSPAITDKYAQSYGNQEKAEFRYAAFQTVTVYSENIDIVRSALGSLSELGKKGVVITGDNYESKIEYLFTGLNDIKPAMIEEATTKAREVAQKFAADSNSSLGKIKKASQGQFSISDRDSNNPHIKKVRVVSTIEYYLSD